MYAVTKHGPRCADHRERPTAPPTCRICSRIAVEVDIVTRVIDAALAQGYAMKIDDGESHRPEKPTRDRDVLIAELMETDDDRLKLYHVAGVETKPAGWIRLVYGNDGYDVISDYTTNLEDLLKPINAYADTLAE